VRVRECACARESVRVLARVCVSLCVCEHVCVCVCVCVKKKKLRSVNAWDNKLIRVYFERKTVHIYIYSIYIS